MAALRVGLAGVGTVGGGIAQILSGQRSLIAQRCGRAIDLVAVADQRPIEALEAELRGHADLKHYSDAVDMANNADVDVIIETIGGYGTALKIANGALGRGVSLVTANKARHALAVALALALTPTLALALALVLTLALILALIITLALATTLALAITSTDPLVQAMLAVHAAELTTIAESNNAKIGWEAAVGGGIPCIRALREGCAANRISYAAGILNGTCNFILTTMKETGRGFDDVLAEAQALGYAETPPDLDVDGIDTAHKLSLVAAVATGCLPNYEAVHTEGIRDISGADVALADELGFSIKLLGIASRIESVEQGIDFRADPYRTCVESKTSGGSSTLPLPVAEAPEGRPVVLQRVHPSLIPKDAGLGATHGVLNGLFTIGNYVGPVFSQGRGAGRDATASACVADIIDLARGTSVPTFGVPAPLLSTMVCASMEQRVGRYYLRMGDNGSSAKATLSALKAAGIETEGIAAGDAAVITATTLEATMMAVTAQLKADGQDVKMIRVEGPW